MDRCSITFAARRSLLTTFEELEDPDVRWTATDDGWSAGEGPEVEGEMADLTLTAAGRSTRLDLLHGPGTPLVAAWLR